LKQASINRANPNKKQTEQSKEKNKEKQKKKLMNVISSVNLFMH